MRWRTALGRTALAMALFVAACETAHRVAAALAQAPSPGTRCAVLVLGYPARADGTPHPVQVIRVAAGVRAWRQHACERIVLSGGSQDGRPPEAEVMARVARDLGVPEGVLVLETRARNTWENVAFGLAGVDGATTVLVASDALHAWRGRRYVCAQRPELCARTGIAVAEMPAWLLWWRVPAAVYELRAWLRDTAMGRAG
jgi:hypothetical protein